MQSRDARDRQHQNNKILSNAKSRTHVYKSHLINTFRIKRFIPDRLHGRALKGNAHDKDEGGDADEDHCGNCGDAEPTLGKDAQVEYEEGQLREGVDADV